jgi:uncharacterized protein
MTSTTPERIHALDVVRGVAVAGILFANVLVFFGQVFIPPDRAAALPTAAWDGTALFIEHVLVDGKFYSVFSLLFGVGFGLQLARGGDAALPRFRRRLRILLVIGAIHAVFVWAGDILMLYALLGFSLPWFARRSDRQLLQWTVGLLLVPLAFYLLALLGWTFANTGSAAEGGGMPPAIMRYFEVMGTGGLSDIFIGNLVLLAGRWIDLIMTMRFPKVLGMFVLGLWLVRAGIATSPVAHRGVITRWAALGWAIGLPANVLAVWAFAQWPYFPPSGGGLIGVAAQAVGIPMLAIGYAATVTLLVEAGNRIVAAFGPVGRMALTNYLTHSLVCITLAYGIGFGLWWRVGPLAAFAIAAAIIAVQIPLSAWWLSRHRFGPAEWVWRRFTYGRAP